MLFVFAAAGVAVGAAPARPRAIDFHRTIDEARHSTKLEQPVVLVFGATWCTWCHKLESDTLTDPKVMTAAGQFLWVKIDIDKEHELAARYGVEGVPVTVVLDKQGRVLGKTAGYMPPAKFVDFLTTSLANPHPEELLPDLLERFAKSQSPADQREATVRLIGQLARPDRLSRDEILAALKKKAPVWPLILGLMADERLAIRAAAAGALKHSTKADLPFQPFADASLRQQQIDDWRKWLAAHPPRP
jgi:thioredoxin-like negative regulator of GroEL